MNTAIKIFSLSLMLICGATASAQQLKGYDKANMNLDVKPGDNFVEYACGNWLKTHPLRDDQMTNGAFLDLRAEPEADSGDDSGVLNEATGKRLIRL